MIVGDDLVVIGLGVWKRRSFKSIESIEQLEMVYKTPCLFHGNVVSVHPTSSQLAMYS